MIRIFAIIFSLFLITSCTLPGTQEESAVLPGGETTYLYEDARISLVLPKSWTGVSTADIPVVRSGDIVLARRSTTPKYGYYNNLVIIRDTLPNIVTSTKYSELNHLQTTRYYLEYTKLRDEVFTFSDSETSRLYVFEARYNETTPRMKFIQVARVCGSDVYLLHVGLTLDKSPDKYIELLRTFHCK